MRFRKSLRAPLLAGAMLAAGSAIAACGGGTPGVLSPTTGPAAPSIPQAAFTPVTTVQSIPAPVATPVGQTPAPGAPPPNIPIPMPSAAGIGGTVGLPLSSTSGATQSTIPANTVITEQLLAPGTAPSGLPPLSFERQVQSTRTARDAAAHTVISYLGLYFSNAVTLASAPVITFNLPATDIVANTNYYLALYDPLRPQLGWQFGFEGPAAVSGNTLTFGGAGTSNPFTYSGFAFYWFGLYAVSASATAPTPAPSASPLPTPTAPATTPTPTPVPAFVVTPTSISLTAVGQSASFAASGAGPFTVSGNDATIATVSPASGTGTFTVTAVKAGTTGITVTDSLNRTATVSVTVTTTTIPIK